jgi:hypothetical protein
MRICVAKAILTFAAADFFNIPAFPLSEQRRKPLYFQASPDFPQSSQGHPQDVVVSNRLRSTP